MDITIPEFKHTISLKSEWQQDFIQGLDCTVVDNKRIDFPERMASGSGYFVKISRAVSVFIVDLVLNEPMRFTRMPSEEDFWIVYYDMSDNYSKHFVDGVKHKTGYKSKLGFAIIDSHHESTYVSSVGERVYSLRLCIRKSFVKSYFQDVTLEKDFKNIFDDEKGRMFYYGHIDSRSKVALYNLKQQSMNDTNYEFLLKSTVHKLFGYFVERLNSNAQSRGLFLEKDLNAIMKTQEYLLSNLLLPFPGLKLLSEIANMSISKYRNLYRNVFGMSPASFFKNEKLILAKELLESRNFKLISDIAYELGYNKISYFSEVYKKHHGDLPHTVFKAKLD
ncbi:AraC family transcriptional regulator [Flavobacterium sp. LS1R47]|uniref:AraC family transcriptional regulator n=1 Tax=Flavobacterium frigoritolerans TaxID=2987686 RepID=A0A9X2ZPR5_9FLAO|nr:AraC family transcriptional regulator [Flavobacterium frigoritolerans]MCV9931568.1 AraC family transcriptional regulator [Flavobacterium frigoritolerans]